MPNSDVTWPVQQAVYAALTGDVDLAADVVGVFDDVPENPGWPYVVVGDAVSSPDNTHDQFGHRTVVTLHVWSTYDGFAEALGLAGHLVRILDHNADSLDVEGHRTVTVRWVQTVPMRDPDADLRHVAARFAIHTETDAA